MDGLHPTTLLYATDSYLRAFEAQVVATDGHAVALDQTAFYPGGGGQMADRGDLVVEGRRFPVASMSKRDGVLWHEFAEDAGDLPEVGTTVTGEIDWPFRYTMMRTHTALHLLCGLIFRDYGAQVTGGQMYPDRARMDFTLATMSQDFLHAIERSVNEAVAADHQLKVYTLPRAKAMKIPDLVRTKVNLLPPEITEIRIVEIVGVDLQADGGTHVRATREVGGIKVLRTENKGKQNKRMEIALTDGDSA
jgi:misacylated tRNA(Ala) deacylase